MTKWTFELIQQEALKYKTRGEFYKKNKKAHEAAGYKKILDTVCSHMSPKITELYDLDELKEEALKYNTRSEFKIKNPGAYQTVVKRKLSDIICSHMPKKVNQSGENSPRFKWSLEKLKEEALKYKTRTDFAKGSPGAYDAAINRDLMEEICEKMKFCFGSSHGEKYIFDMVKNTYPKAHLFRDLKVNISNKPHIKGFDIDIYIPELRKGIEFDGKYWHSEAGLKRSRPSWSNEDIKNYHEIKDSWFASKGIKILHIREQDWLEDKETCIKKCLEFLGSK